MSGSFSITTPTSTVRLDAGRQGHASFLVTNTSGRLLVGRAILRWVPDTPGSGAWLTVDGRAEHDYPVAGTQQYTVTVQVPPTAPAGPMTFRLDMQDVDRADEPLEGQTVTLTVPEPLKPRPFPWWVPAVVAVVLVAGATAYLLGRGPTNNCVSGYGWRLANATDHVCVTPQSHRRTLEDNRLADSRRSPTGGPYGPNTCLNGYVWRTANPTDLVCVTVDTRSQTLQENQEASKNTKP